MPMIRNLSLVSTALLWGPCEGPPRQPNVAPNASNVPPQAGPVVRSEPTRASAEPVMPATSHRLVDGRAQVPLLVAVAPDSLTSVQGYDFGTVPPPLRPGAGQHVVSPIAKPLTSPVVQESVKGGRLVLAPYRAGWEAPLMAAGFQILDRTSLPVLEFELFLQDTRAPAASVANATAPVQSVGSQSAAAGARVVGRADYSTPGGDPVH